MKKYWYLVFLVVAALVLSACGNNDDDDNEPMQIYRPYIPAPTPRPVLGTPIVGFTPDARADVVVELWHASIGAARAGMTQLIEAFHEYQFYVRVHEVVFNSRAALEASLLQAERQGNLPHIAAVSPSEITYFRFMQALLPLDTFMDDPHVGLHADELADILPVFQGAALFAEVWYGLPFAKDVPVLYYNRAYFADRAVPATWAALTSEAQQVGLGINLASDILWATLLLQHGGDYFDYAEGAVAFASEEGVAAMEIVAALMALAVTDDENGTPGLVIGRSLHPPTGDWGSTVLPGVDGNHATEFLGESLVLFENVRHSVDARVGAWEFLRFTLQPEPAATWAIMSGSLPVTHSAQFLPRYRAHLIHNPQTRAGEASLDNGFWRNRHGHHYRILLPLREEINAILAGTVSAEAGLERAAERANEALAQ